MGAPLLRPTFAVPVDRPREEVIEALRGRIADSDELAGRWRGKGRWVEIYLPEEEQKIWSPYLSIRIDTTQAGCSVFGRFAPHPEVWTFFMFLYVLVAFIFLFGATFGYVQWASNEPAWGLWAVWLGGPALILIHLASFVGSRLGQEQMARLKAEWDTVMKVLDEG